MVVNQPMGRVTKLEYRDQNPKMAADTSAFVVHFRAPDGEEYEHPLNNPQWMIHNDALQLMALNGFQPTDIDGTSMDVAPSRSGGAVESPSDDGDEVEDWQWLIPVAPDGNGGFLLAANVLEGGVEALEEAEWFSGSDDEESTDGDSSGPHGGGSPDPGTGNRGGVDHEEDDEGGVDAELTPEEDTGVQVTVE